jgi:hypothetical protein
VIPALHPAIRADWLVLQRAGWVASARAIGGPALLLACCVAVACGDLYGGYGWCLAAGALLGLGCSYAFTYHHLLDALERWRFGWCGALPTRRGATVRTLLLVASAALVVSLAFVTVLLLGVSMSAPHREDFPCALAGTDLAIVMGAVIAAARVSRGDAVTRVHQADGIRDPLFALSWLNDRRVPHLLDWQRRAALVRWRRGGGVAVVALVLFAIPDGISVLRGIGLILLMISLTWLDVALRACAKATAEASRLLKSMPLEDDCLRVASLRYPMLAVVGAFIFAVVGTVLMGGGSAIAGLWGAACTVAVSAWPLRRVVVAARRSGRST